MKVEEDRRGDREQRRGRRRHSGEEGCQVNGKGGKEGARKAIRKVAWKRRKKQKYSRTNEERMENGKEMNQRQEAWKKGKEKKG